MLTRILDGRGSWVPLLDDWGPHVSVVGQYGSMLGLFRSHLWSLRVPLVLFVPSWTSLRSSVDIRVMSAPISRRASTLMRRSMMMER